MKKLSTHTFDRIKGVRQHIMVMMDMAAQLCNLKIPIDDTFLVHTHQDQWSVNDLLTMRVQEEESLKNEKHESANFVTHSKGKFTQDKNKGKGVMKPKHSVPKDKSKNLCFFCNRPSHEKKDCSKFKQWLEKKSINLF